MIATAEWLRELLWVSPSIHLASALLDERELTPSEQTLLASFESEERRRDWLRGRSRLKEVLADLGESVDTTTIGFPHPRFSVSHSGDLAIAVGIAPAPGIAGVGVDFERNRLINPRTARYFLRDEERTVLGDIVGQEDLLRLWTVKEALFKAHPENDGQVVRDYTVADPEALSGTGLHRRTARRFLYQSERLADGYLTVAVCLTKEL